MPIDETSRSFIVKKTKFNSKLEKRSKKFKSSTYFCRFCEKSFSSPSHLSRHELTHTGEKPSLCSECGQQFSQSSSLERHQRTKHRRDRLEQQSFQCPLCQEYFSLKHNMTMHQRRLHHTQTEFFCQICSAYFSCNSALQKHRNFRHRTFVEQNNKSDDDFQFNFDVI